MECGPQIDGRVTGQPLNKVTGFIYLGLFVRSDGDFLPDAHAWVSMAWLTRWQVTGVLCDRQMPTQHKDKITKPSYAQSRYMVQSVGQPPPSTSRSSMVWRWRCSVGLLASRDSTVSGMKMSEGACMAPIVNKMCLAQLRWNGHIIRKRGWKIGENSLSLPRRQLRGHANKWTLRQTC